MNLTHGDTRDREKHSIFYSLKQPAIETYGNCFAITLSTKIWNHGDRVTGRSTGFVLRVKLCKLLKHTGLLRNWIRQNDSFKV